MEKTPLITTVSRRAMLAGGALLGAGAVAMSATAPVTASADAAVEETATPVGAYDCDVCIMGAGISGLCASVEAAQLGLSVIVMERYGAAGGGGRGTEGVFGVGSYMQQEAGIEVTPVEVLKNEMEYHHNRVDGTRWLELIHASGENVKWLADLGVGFTGVVDTYRGGDIATFHWFGEGRAAVHMTPALYDAAQAAGVKFLFNTSMVQAMQDETGAICGALGRKIDGDYIQVNCKAVIVASGGCANSEDCLQKGGWGTPREILHSPSVINNGDGLAIVEACGGANSLDRLSGMFLPGVKGSRGKGAGTMGGGTDGLIVAARSSSSIWINQNGTRICAENAGARNWQALGIPLLRHYRVFSIFDQASFDAAYAGIGRPLVSAEENQAEMDERVATNPYGDTFRADTIEELAAQVVAMVGDMDEQKFIDTYQRYNELCEKGVDEDYAKPAELMIPIVNPPFYCLEMHPYLVSTFGGIRTNNNFECITPDNKVIPGLYAAGCDSTELWPEIYTLNVPGGANAHNVNSGRVTARRAADLIGDGATGVIVESGDTSPARFDFAWETPASMKDGVYEASADGLAGTITATVTIEGGKIVEVSQASQYETPYVAGLLMNTKVIPAVVEAGSLDIDVDVLGGATVSNVALMNAIADCCEQAAR